MASRVDDKTLDISGHGDPDDCVYSLDTDEGSDGYSFGDAVAVEPRWWWLSFADPNLPEGEQFLGVAIVQGHDITTATMRSHMLGVNPGGEVCGMPLLQWPDGAPDRFQNRLMDRNELEALDALLGGSGLVSMIDGEPA